MTAQSAIARLRELRAKATAGPWVRDKDRSQDHGQQSIRGPDDVELAAVMSWVGEHYEESIANAVAIVAAMNSLDALLECASLLVGRNHHCDAGSLYFPNRCGSCSGCRSRAALAALAAQEPQP